MLSRDNIRVLHLVRAVNDSDLLRCTLEQVLAYNPPEYTAMSYAWDAETPSEPVYCEESVLLITSNCEKELEEFREHPESQIMWIDSICINQSSVEERSRQVNLMWTIYWRASRVWVWLGEADEKTLKVLQLFRESVENPLEHDNWKYAIKSYLLSQFDISSEWSALSFVCFPRSQSDHFRSSSCEE